MTFDARPFRASRWARGPHAQTLLARALRSSRGPEYRRERLETPDGDFLDLDWAPDPGGDAPIVLVLHGLEGSADRRYVRNICRDLLSEGVWPAALNFRGCSGEPNRALRFYHSGETVDPAWVIGVLRDRYPGRAIGAFGFSLGGNVLLKMIGERGDGGRSLVDAAAAMSVPYDLGAGCDLLEQTRMGRQYAAYFLRSLRRKVRAKEARLSGVVELESVYASRTIRAFDEAFTAPLNGFRNATDYYAESSSSRYLSGVRVPTLLLHAEDDPFLPSECVPIDKTGRNPYVELRLEPSGGHVGFLEGGPWRPRFWADEMGARFLAQTLGASHRDAREPSRGAQERR